MSSSDSPSVSLIETLRSNEATLDAAAAALAVVDDPQCEDAEAGALVNAIAKSPVAVDAVPLLVQSLRRTSSPDRAMVLMRALRRNGGAAEALPELLAIAGGVPWDPERYAWTVALGTLSHLAAHPEAVAAVEAAAARSDLPETDHAWARRCAERVR